MEADRKGNGQGFHGRSPAAVDLVRKATMLPVRLSRYSLSLFFWPSPKRIVDGGEVRMLSCTSLLECLMGDLRCKSQKGSDCIDSEANEVQVGRSSQPESRLSMTQILVEFRPVSGQRGETMCNAPVRS